MFRAGSSQVAPKLIVDFVYEQAHSEDPRGELKNIDKKPLSEEEEILWTGRIKRRAELRQRQA